MFHWFRQMSVIARLRGLALMALVAMLALSSSLLWTGYQQRLADRQAAASQGIELAHASVQWAYARQQFGKLNPTQARQHTLAVLERLRQGRAIDTTGDMHSAMLGRTALTIGVVLAVSAMLWLYVEVTARDLRRAQAQDQAQDQAADASPEASSSLPARHAAQVAGKGRDPGRGPEAYRQKALPAVQRQALSVPQAGTPSSDPATATVPANNGIDDPQGDPNEAAVQEVRRLRMAGAI